MECPGEGADEVPGRQHDSREREQCGPPVAVQSVVEGHRARMQLALGEAGARAGEEGDIGAETECEQLPPAGAECDSRRDRCSEEQRRENGEEAATECG